MGSCASVEQQGKYVEAVRIEDPARKQKVLEKRLKVAELVKKHLSPVGLLYPVVELEPWKHFSGDHIDPGEVLDSAFDDKSRLEINIAMSGGISKIGKREYCWMNATVLSAYVGNDVVSTSIFVEHKTKGGKVFEIVWLATHRSQEGKGVGGTLFEWILALAGHKQVSAVLVTANTNIVGWWLAQGKKRTKQCSLQATMLWKCQASSKLPRKDLDEATTAKMNNLLASAHLQDSPTAAVSYFYDSPSQRLTQCAAPFRYDISNTVHMWYIIKARRGSINDSKTPHATSPKKKLSSERRGSINDSKNPKPNENAVSSKKKKEAISDKNRRHSHKK